MDFKSYIELNRKLVYDTICDYVRIKEPKLCYEIMRDYIDRQGSYRRPGLVMLTGQMFGAKLEELALPSAAQQLSEDWILMQDDAQDDSELRRGKPAMQKLYGWVLATNASEIGHISMWRMLKDYIIKYGPEKGNRLYEKFYDMLDYTVGGQHIENNFIRRIRDIKYADEDLYLSIVDRKTCYYTVYGPMQIGAIVAGEPDNTLELLKEIGRPAGIAFQIQDDILDMTADEKIFGKKNFGDLYEGKVTLMILHAYKNATKEEKEKISAIYSKSRENKEESEIAFLREVIEKYGGLTYAEEQVTKYAEIAKRLIAENWDSLPQNEFTPIMASAIEQLYIRKK